MPKSNCRALTINGHSDVSPKIRSLGLAMVLLTLFGAQNPAQAETLYQWKEAEICPAPLTWLEASKPMDLFKATRTRNLLKFRMATYP